METYVVDAHSLVWFIAEDERLSLNAKQILEQAEEAKVQVLIPTVVLAEITHISRKKRVSITIEEVLDRIEQSSGFVIIIRFPSSSLGHCSTNLSQYNSIPFPSGSLMYIDSDTP